jgi:hypothetical protein
VKDKDVRTRIYDWNVPIAVDGQPGAIAGTLFWTPVPSSGLPLPLIIAFVVVIVPLAIGAVLIRRRRTATEAW